MAIETEASGLTTGDQLRNLILNLHEEIETLKRQRDFYYKSWIAEKERNETVAGKAPKFSAYR